ncbi:hypothetical protein GGS24DRAFT_446387 [Hypoxylon argillaceum]|nr:hypothetical protein GGS24DRAFT_446387 [Hypoxylon argillaceum]
MADHDVRRSFAGGAQLEKDGVEPDLDMYAAIMASKRLDPRGAGYVKVYILVVVIFLCLATSSAFNLRNGALSH